MTGWASVAEGGDGVPFDVELTKPAARGLGVDVGPNRRPGRAVGASNSVWSSEMSCSFLGWIGVTTPLVAVASDRSSSEDSLSVPESSSGPVN